jgi:hypothetical protein
MSREHDEAREVMRITGEAIYRHSETAGDVELRETLDRGIQSLEMAKAHIKDVTPQKKPKQNR